MENIVDIKKSKKISGGLAKEAELFLYKNYVYKLFISKANLQLKTKILDELYDKPVNNCARVCSILYDDDLLGYSMEYYKKYCELAKFKKTPIYFKKIYVDKLIDIYKELKTRGFIFYDFHGHNVLVNDEELRLIDIDSCLEFSDENDKLGSRYLNEFVLSLVFDTNYFDRRQCYGILTKNDVEAELYSDLSYNYGERVSLDELNEYIQGINDKEIKAKKKRLAKIC